MSKLFQKYPLPWTVKPDPFNASKCFLVDALGRQVNLDTDTAQDLKELTELLPNSKKRQLGWSNKSEQLFAVKDTYSGNYLGQKSIMRTQHFRSLYQAKKRANRLNDYGKKSQWVVVELKLESKGTTS